LGKRDGDPQPTVATELDLLEKWATSNLAASKRDFVQYWVAKVPAVLCGPLPSRDGATDPRPDLSTLDAEDREALRKIAEKMEAPRRAADRGQGDGRRRRRRRIAISGRVNIADRSEPASAGRRSTGAEAAAEFCFAAC
jgi:hypothetical protein